MANDYTWLHMMMRDLVYKLDCLSPLRSKEANELYTVERYHRVYLK